MSTVLEKPVAKEKPERVLAKGAGPVDRENRIIAGVVIAELGTFHSQGRGQFTSASLDMLAKLGSELSVPLKARFCHPNMSNDGLGKFLGRFHNVRRDKNRVIGDLHISETAMNTNIEGGTPLGQYVMDLAEEDPKALETSFVLQANKEYLKTPDGDYERDEAGNRLPPVWIPTKLLACDVVDDGDAVHNGFLSTRNTSSLAAAATDALDHYLDQFFPDATKEEFAQRSGDFLNRYILNRFGETPEMSTNTAPAQTAPVVNEDAIVSKLYEKLSPQLDAMNKATESLLAANKRQEDEQRAATIAALCSSAGLPEKANEFIGDTSLSVDKVREQLFNSMIERQNTNKGETQGQNPGGAGGGKGEKQLSPQEKAGAEYDAAPTTFEALGFTRDSYIAQATAEKKPNDANPLAALL